MATKNTEKPAASVETQTAEVKRLEEELTVLRGALVEANSKAKAGTAEDSANALNLKARYEALPALINTAKQQLYRLRIERMEAELPVAQAAIEPLSAKVADTAARLREAQAAAQTASGEMWDAQARIRSLQADIAGARREVARLEREAEPVRPIKSYWQQAASA